MKLEQSLSFRKVIIPWYDADSACTITIVFLLLVLFFSLVGVSVAQSLPSPAMFLWVPVLLASLSAIVLLTVSARLIRRHVGHSSD
ncbi:MAG: hypothetical protein ABIL58_24360 [Pseudomonadota bacterium]